MSTNHRPQLESKRGKVIKIKDTIQHAERITTTNINKISTRYQE